MWNKTVGMEATVLKIKIKNLKQNNYLFIANDG